MRKKITLAAAALALAAGLTACSASADAGTSASPSSSASSSASSSSSSDSRTGTFAGLNDKKVSGTVSISGGTLTLSGFSSDEGPDLHVYLTSGTDEAAVSAGKEIKAVAFDKTDQTFSLSGIDSSSYTDVVIHCDKAKAVFGAATLS
ncbi:MULTISPECIES: DM13 domain-containing protein [unclassified Leifsonia]|uniref:DM13 domain-containing protein n=1 Tax=unclassified Leifsonia TaxID=2663824 RepID=UPI0008A7D210|nr:MULTISPECIES: DM13 domain-containing protein [unclassified Leifsonia]SEI13527.1 Electron transfer DM13 [Leifsonia sp. CL154]SFL99171.1 Electron transfer DM13 [Leifsonia sp. CL147]